MRAVVGTARSECRTSIVGDIAAIDLIGRRVLQTDDMGEVTGPQPIGRPGGHSVLAGSPYRALRRPSTACWNARPRFVVQALASFNPLTEGDGRWRQRAIAQTEDAVVRSQPGRLKWHQRDAVLLVQLLQLR